MGAVSTVYSRTIQTTTVRRIILLFLLLRRANRWLHTQLLYHEWTSRHSFKKVPVQRSIKQRSIKPHAHEKH